MITSYIGPYQEADESTAPSAFLFVKTGKAIPVQAWTGPEGFRRFRLPDFKTVGT
jgi:hypothetical protein